MPQAYAHLLITHAPICPLDVEDGVSDAKPRVSWGLAGWGTLEVGEDGALGSPSGGQEGNLGDRRCSFEKIGKGEALLLLFNSLEWRGAPKCLSNRETQFIPHD